MIKVFTEELHELLLSLTSTNYECIHYKQHINIASCFTINTIAMQQLTFSNLILQLQGDKNTLKFLPRLI